MRRDEDAALHVVEALLAGMIILTAVLFMTNLAKPSPTAFQSGIDLERVSVDTLRILENRPASDDEGCDFDTETATPEVDPPDPCYPNRLDQMVSHAMGFGVASDAEQQAETDVAEGFLNQVIPVGNRWLVRLDNGEEPLVLLPTSGSNVALTPRGAKAAETFFVPQWQGLVDECGAAPSQPGHVPGGQGWGVLAAGEVLQAPTGSPVAPGDSPTWEAWWNDQLVDDDNNPAPYTDRVPRTAPYGWWWHDQGVIGTVEAGECHFVGLPDDTATNYPSYGIQLVVWPIAG